MDGDEHGLLDFGRANLGQIPSWQIALQSVGLVDGECESAPMGCRLNRVLASLSPLTLANHEMARRCWQQCRAGRLRHGIAG